VSGDYTVQLDEVFHGPMDLLLHLVREQEVEIHEVSIHRVVDGYFDYLRRLEELDIEVAGDFLVLASSLMAIKSRSLLPREEVELDDALDPEDELIQRLLEYRRFKEAADDLDDRRLSRAARHSRGYRGEIAEHTPERTLELGELTVWDLLGAFSRLMRETLAGRPHRVRADAHPLRYYVSAIGHAVLAKRETSLRELLLGLDPEPSREVLVGAFCALLELVKLGVVRAYQEDLAGDIRIAASATADEDLEGVIGATTFMDEEDGALEGPLAGPPPDPLP